MYSSTTDTEQFDENGNSYGKATLSYSNYPSYNLVPDFDDEGRGKFVESDTFTRTTYEGQNAIELSKGDIIYNLGNLQDDFYLDCYVKYAYTGETTDPLRNLVVYTYNNNGYERTYPLGDADAVDEKAWLCLYSKIPEKDPVKYATIAACGNDLDCMGNAHQQMMNDCNGDETCLNALDDDVDDIINHYGDYCIEQAQTEIIAQQGYRISANAGAKTTDTWEATVTFKNLNTNQNINVGKSFEGYFFFESYKDYENGGNGILQNSGIIE